MHIIFSSFCSLEDIAYAYSISLLVCYTMIYNLPNELWTFHVRFDIICFNLACRMCEICSETAKNITGVGDVRFMEEWSESQTGETGSGPSGGTRRCLSGQPLCNFLMACLVIAFVLPWFFRVNMLWRDPLSVCSSASSSVLSYRPPFSHAVIRIKFFSRFA